MSKMAYLLLVFIPLGYLLGFRSPKMPICVDSYTYMDIFDYAVTRPLNELWELDSYAGAEFGYLIVNKLFSYVSADYYDFQIFSALIFCLCALFFIYRDVDVANLGVAIFLGLDFYFQAYNISRQMLVTMIFALLMPLFHNRKKWIAIILIFLLSTIHTTSLLFSIILLVDLLPSKMDKYLPLFLILILVFFEEILIAISPLFLKYSDYFDNSGGHSFSMGLSSVFYGFLIVISLYSYYFVKSNTHRDRINAFLSIFAIMCIFLGMKMNYMERIGILFLPYTLLTISNLYNRLPSKSRGTYNLLITALMLLFFFLRAPKEYISF